jgi:acetyl esterase/lipase
MQGCKKYKLKFHMKKIIVQILLLFISITTGSYAQTNPVIDAFPKGTILKGDIPYNGDTLNKHLLDIYLPANATGKLPLVILIHGGGWLSNDKYADIGYMKKTVAEIVSSGFALASIDYRFSTQAVFPAQIQDCNRAVSFCMTMQISMALIKIALPLWAFLQADIWLHW